MEEEALQLVVTVVIQPVRASCAVCASRLNANYLQDVTLCSGPLRHDMHLCVHRHYNECWAKRNSHGLKMKETAQTNTHMCCFLFSQPPSAPPPHGTWLCWRVCQCAHVCQQLEENDCLSGYSEKVWNGINGLGDEGMPLREPLFGGLFPWTISGLLSWDSTVWLESLGCFPALCWCCWSDAATASWQTHWSVAHKLILHDWVFNIQRLWPTGG